MVDLAWDLRMEASSRSRSMTEEVSTSLPRPSQRLLGPLLVDLFGALRRVGQDPQ